MVLPPLPRSYDEAVTRLGRRARVLVAHNTRLHRVDADTVAVRLHATDVVTFHADGRIVLDSGGWRTVTTKSRMNRCLPDGWRVASDSRKGGWGLYRDGARVCGFDDGVEIEVTR